MKVGILGSGVVAQALGRGFASRGHDVKLGTRDPEKLKAWAEQVGGKVSVGSFADASRFGELIVLATLWTGTENAIRIAGAEAFAGKVVIDTTNPLDFSVMPPRLSIGHTDSAGESIQRWLPNARVVKAFNTVGNAHMVDPHFPGGPPDMPICGDDATAKQTVTAILESFGWSVVDVGGMEAARYVEPLAMVWILYYFQRKSGDHAFKLLRK